MVIRQVSARGVRGVPAYRQGRQIDIWPVRAGCIIMAQVAPADCARTTCPGLDNHL